MGTQIDYKVLFALQKQILKSKHLTSEQKNEILLEAIEEAEKKQSSTN
jgi:hypothetical protein